MHWKALYNRLDKQEKKSIGEMEQEIGEKKLFVPESFLRAYGPIHWRQWSIKCSYQRNKAKFLVGHVKANGPQQHQSLTDDSATSSVLHKYTANDGNSKSTQTASLWVIGRRSVPDLGAIWDSLNGLATLEASYDPQTTMQLLESSFLKLPQPKDSQLPSYIPGVLDTTTTDVADHVVAGVMACDESQFDAIIEKNILFVLSVGALKIW
ncbi:general negative regulator of transcription subunit 3 isoform X1 [Tanacetum coccineum]|uniref:General negative regulator of transcription subunit 3 isoform X1 n=1 Tax=Tanacetum coccineum TaxID=301880 RepID=A0ABQ5IE79_9ASTR